VTHGPTLSGNNIGPPDNVGLLSRPWQLRGVSAVWPAGVILFNWPRYGGVALFPLASRLQHCMDDCGNPELQSLIRGIFNCTFTRRLCQSVDAAVS